MSLRADELLQRLPLNPSFEAAKNSSIRQKHSSSFGNGHFQGKTIGEPDIFWQSANAFRNDVERSDPKERLIELRREHVHRINRQSKLDHFAIEQGREKLNSELPCEVPVEKCGACDHGQREPIDDGFQTTSMDE